MIRSADTQKVILPEQLLTSLLIDDLNACPNLKVVYFSNATHLEPFNQLKARKLTHKDLSSCQNSKPPESPY